MPITVMSEPATGDDREPGLPVVSDYDAKRAGAFSAHRELPAAGMLAWHAVLADHIRPRPGLRLLDLGAGTGLWSRAFADWFGVEVLAVEPAAEMRARAVVDYLVDGSAEHIPLADASVDAAWLSTVIHHIRDLPTAARELRRVVRAGGTVLIRSVFPEHCDRVGLFRLWPEAVESIASWPKIDDVRRAFDAAGFSKLQVETVYQQTAASTSDLLDTLTRDAHTPLQLISDSAFARGLARARQAAQNDDRPVLDGLDLLILQ